MSKIDKQLVISILSNGKVQVESRAGHFDFDTLIQTTNSILLNAMNQIVDNVPNQHKEDAKGELYDVYNRVASRTLEMFAPEYELRPTLTQQAILEAENRIMQRTIRRAEKHNKKTLSKTNKLK